MSEHAIQIRAISIRNHIEVYFVDPLISSPRPYLSITDTTAFWIYYRCHNRQRKHQIHSEGLDVSRYRVHKNEKNTESSIRRRWAGTSVKYIVARTSSAIFSFKAYGRIPVMKFRACLSERGSHWYRLCWPRKRSLACR